MNSELNLYATMNKAIDLIPLNADEVNLLNISPGAVLTVQIYVAENIKRQRQQEEMALLRSVLKKYTEPRYFPMLRVAASTQGAPLIVSATHADWKNEKLSVEFVLRNGNWFVEWTFSSNELLSILFEKNVETINLYFKIDGEYQSVAVLDIASQDSLLANTDYLLKDIEPNNILASGNLYFNYEPSDK